MLVAVAIAATGISSPFRLDPSEGTVTLKMLIHLDAVISGIEITRMEVGRGTNIRMMAILVLRTAQKEISPSFLGRAVSSLFLTALWGPRAPRAWVAQGTEPP